MTEAEAGTKWCPFVRAAYPGITGSYNRGLKELDDGRVAVDLHMAHCVGPRCMMWRDYTFQDDAPDKVSNGDCGLK